MPGMRTTLPSLRNYWNVTGPSRGRPTCAGLNGIISAGCRTASCRHGEGPCRSREWRSAWTPDGRRLVSVGTTRAFDRSLPTRRRSQALGCGHADFSFASAQRSRRTTCFVASSARMASGLPPAAAIKMVRIWNLETGDLIATLEGHTAARRPGCASARMASTWHLGRGVGGFTVII